MTLITRHSSSGFSLVELMVAVFVSLILASVAVFNYASARRNVKTNVAANMVSSLLQQARQSTITSRKQHRVTITRSPDPKGNINLISIATINPSDGSANIIREEYLPQDVILEPSPDAVLAGSPVPIPANAPFNAAIPAGAITFIYNVDGSVSDGAGNPLTCSIFFSDSPLGRNLPITRAISLYSSTGEVKYWFYDGAKFVSGARNN